MNFRRSHAQHETGFDLTPMIDVILFVFMFFLVATQFIQAGREPMDLPREPGEGVAEVIPGEVVVMLDREGRVKLGMDVLDGDALPARLAEIAGGAGGSASALSVVVRADRNCAAVHLNRLALRLSQAGVKRWRLATTGEGA